MYFWFVVTVRESLISYSINFLLYFGTVFVLALVCNRKVSAPRLSRTTISLALLLFKSKFSSNGARIFLVSFSFAFTLWTSFENSVRDLLNLHSSACTSARQAHSFLRGLVLFHMQTPHERLRACNFYLKQLKFLIVNTKVTHRKRLRPSCI